MITEQDLQEYRELKKAKGLTLKDIAEGTGIEWTNVSKLLNGKNKAGKYTGQALKKFFTSLK